MKSRIRNANLDTHEVDALANCCYRKRLAQIRAVLDKLEQRKTERKANTPSSWGPVCPRCRTCVLHLLRYLKEDDDPRRTTRLTTAPSGALKR